ncbi:MAG: hypothetical protein ACJ761_01285 [Chloroflexota bacterium]
MRRLGLCLAIIGWLFATVSPALAAKPEKAARSADSATFAAGDVCDFPLRLDYPDARLHAIVFDRRDGAFRENVGGRLVARATNLSTGASVTRNSSGPARLWVASDGQLVVRYGGSSLFPFFDGDAGGPGVLYTTGPLVLHIGDDGFIASVKLPNNVEDVCATLS